MSQPLPRPMATFYFSVMIVGNPALSLVKPELVWKITWVGLSASFKAGYSNVIAAFLHWHAVAPGFWYNQLDSFGVR